ncbi:MAG: cysteine desulfurase/selenocysteine lyase [Chitinophagales bacterium]|jgi:cysteine desulfurase/selenocysteine lyase
MEAIQKKQIKTQFPILDQEVHGKALVYFDNAATSQKPKRVIDAITRYYTEYNSNIHRGAHYLANKATEEYEQARERIANYIGASAQEVNFVRGTTEAVNLVANAWGDLNIHEGDEILVSGLEHHSNMVPWQMLAERSGAKIRIIPVLEDGSLDQAAFNNLLSAQTKLLAVNHVSNALGTINPVKEMIGAAHEVGAKVFIDGAQAIPHLSIDVKDLDADFYAFSGHKAYGPTGIGILYGKEELLLAMKPYHGGGEMIKEVRYDGFTVNALPYKFEAGTPNICGAIALGEAIAFMEDVGIDKIAQIEADLLAYATEKISAIAGVKIYGTAANKASVLSFLVEGVHPFDLGILLDKQGIAIRTGHHCCQPLMGHFDIEGTCRASFAVYNTKEEIDLFIKALERALMML